MDHLAENRFTLTKGLFLEGMLRISRDGYGKAARKYSLVFLALWAAMAAFICLTGGTFSQTLIYLAIVGVILLWLNVLSPRSHAKKSWEALVKRHGEHMERRVRFFRDHLEVDGDCTEKYVDYPEILEIKESRHLYILICADKAGILIAKEGFTRGDAANILALIQGA